MYLVTFRSSMWPFPVITGYGHSTNCPGHHGTVVARTVGSNASYHSHSLENATHLAGTGVQVLIYMGQMQPASSSIWWSVDARCDSHTDFHLQQKIEYSGFHYRICPQYQPSWPPRYRGGPDGWEQCFLSFALPRERYPPGRHWRAGPYLYGSNAAS